MASNKEARHCTAHRFTLSSSWVPTDPTSSPPQPVVSIDVRAAGPQSPPSPLLTASVPPASVAVAVLQVL